MESLKVGPSGVLMKLRHLLMFINWVEQESEDTDMWKMTSAGGRQKLVAQYKHSPLHCEGESNETGDTT